ncbi:MAG: hypothetical protein JWM32_539 [Verrucomicrobia bacterium]|nr:hypothetical protein [Verrucomicrobiota bacterium]
MNGWFCLQSPRLGFAPASRTRAAIAAACALIWATGTRPATTLVFTGTFTDRGVGAPIPYRYEAGIQTPMTPTGNVLNFSGTAPGSSQINWRDPEGATIQGDARYRDPVHGDGTFVLNATYYTSPGHPVTTTVGSVNFTNGVVEGVSPGADANGIPANSGIAAAPILATLDEKRMAKVGDPVQIATGAESMSRTLFEFGGGRKWSFELRYNSILAAAADAQGPVGYGWSHPFEARVAASGANCVVSWNETRSSVFTPVPGVPDTFLGADDASRHDVLLVQPAGGWSLKHRDQSCLIFNAGGRLVEDRDPQGRPLVIRYDNGRISSITDSVSGSFLAFAYVAGTSRIETITDAMGGKVSLGYTSAEILNRITNQNGKQVTFTYGPNRSLVTVTDHEGNVLVANTYDSLGRIVAQSDGIAGRRPLKFSYIERGLPGSNLYAASDTTKSVPLPLPTPQGISMASFTRLDGEVVQYAYDGNGRLLSGSVNGQTTRVNYDDQGHAVSVIDPAGAISAVGREIVVVVTDRTGAVAEYHFNSAYNLGSVTDALNRTTTYAYDSENNLISIENALKRATRFTYDAAGNILTMIDPAGGVTTHAYDARNNLIRTTKPNGGVIARIYDAQNNLLSAVDAVGEKTSWTYDHDSLPLTATTASGGVYQYVHALGVPVQVTDPSGVVTRFGYDANVRLAYREDAHGKRTRYSYDAVGNCTTVTNPLNEIFSAVYDHRNRLREVTDPAGATTNYDYDPNGNVRAVTDALGKTTTFTYDDEDRLVGVRDALGRETKRTLDAGGRAISSCDPAGNVTIFDRDDEDRELAITDASGDKTTFGYEARGLLTRVTNPGGFSFAASYDSLGRCVGLIDPMDRKTNWFRDMRGRLLTVQGASEQGVFQDYDSGGRRVSVGGVNTKTTFSYDAADRLASISTPMGFRTAFTYENEVGSARSSNHRRRPRLFLTMMRVASDRSAIRWGQSQR